MNQLQKEFTKQLSENQRIVHKICKIYTDNPHDHEDLFQEIVIQLWKSYPQFRGDAKFSTWMYRIGLNTALALFNKKSKTILINTDNPLENIKIANEEHEEDSEKIKAMYDAIHQLSDVEKALIMMYLDDKPYREIGEILGITEGNARVKMNRAKEKLRTLIKK
ncbi:MAG: sigma-70 family RNA polymerase sigma factor [Flavobacteriaceae bacterium]|nr:sigma-70 family RNA polymerase sigma factor [Flavobacteriaceae bacterium]